MNSIIQRTLAELKKEVQSRQDAKSVIDATGRNAAYSPGILAFA